VAAPVRRSCEATDHGADGVVSSAESFAELTTPSAPFNGGFAAFFLASRPPLLFKEGKILF